MLCDNCNTSIFYDKVFKTWFHDFSYTSRCPVAGEKLVAYPKGSKQRHADKLLEEVLREV